jgi:hypothetical protein
MFTEDMWSESLLIHLVFKVVFIFPERWISDRYAGSVVILCKAFTIRRSIHDGNLPAGNDISRDPEYGLGMIGSESLNIESIPGFRIPTIIGMYRGPQGFLLWTYLRILRIFTWNDDLCMIYFSVLESVHSVICANCSGKLRSSSDQDQHSLQKAISFKDSPGVFLKSPVVSEIAIPNHA